MTEINPKDIGQRFDLLTSLAGKIGLEVAQAVLLAGMHEESLGLYVLRVDRDKNLRVTSAPIASPSLPALEVISTGFTPSINGTKFGPCDHTGVARAALFLTLFPAGAGTLINVVFSARDAKGILQKYYEAGYFSSVNSYVVPYPVYSDDINFEITQLLDAVTTTVTIALLRRFV